MPGTKHFHLADCMPRVKGCGVRIEIAAEQAFWKKGCQLLWMHHNPSTIKFLLTLIISNSKANFPPQTWHKGRGERKVLELPNLPTHSFQSKTYGNPFLQPGSPVLQVQMRSSQDHRFFCKEKQHRFTVCIWAQELFTQWNAGMPFDSHPVST